MIIYLNFAIHASRRRRRRRRRHHHHHHHHHHHNNNTQVKSDASLMRWQDRFLFH
jgi:hypothetical protein